MPGRKDVVMGALSSDGGNAVYPLLLNAFLGTRFKVVLGYQGGNTIQLAMERGEVDGRAAVVWSGLKAGWPQWIAEKKINIIVQIGLKKEPDLPDVPLLLDLAQDARGARDLPLRLERLAPWDFRSLAPPGVPAERVAALRRALLRQRWPIPRFSPTPRSAACRSAPSPATTCSRWSTRSSRRRRM